MQDDWQKEKRDFLQSLSRISTLPRTNAVDTSTGTILSGQKASIVSSPQVSSGPSGVELVPLANKSILERKASAYAEVVKNLNNARERGLQFKVWYCCFLVKSFFSIMLLGHFTPMSSLVNVYQFSQVICTRHPLNF